MINKQIDTMETENNIKLAPGIFISKNILDFKTSHASGHGGQNINKVETKVMLSVSLTDLPLTEAGQKRFKEKNARFITKNGIVEITSQKDRHQHMNKENCLDLLGELINDAQQEPKKREKTKHVGPSINDIQENTHRKYNKALRKPVEITEYE